MLGLSVGLTLINIQRNQTNFSGLSFEMLFGNGNYKIIFTTLPIRRNSSRAAITTLGCTPSTLLLRRVTLSFFISFSLAYGELNLGQILAFLELNFLSKAGNTIDLIKANRDCSVA